MGTGDRKDPTTDFFDTTKQQCVEYKAYLQKLGVAPDVATKMDQVIVLCDEAIAKGRQRSDQAAVVALLNQIRISYEALPQKAKDDFVAEKAKAVETKGGTKV